MWFKRKYLGLLGLGIGIAVAGLVAMTALVPTTEYDSKVIDEGENEITTPAKVVKDFLLNSDGLPQPGTGLAQEDSDLTWAVAPGDSARQITSVQVLRVKLTSGDSLFMSLIDDDPTCMAEVDTTVITADGQKTHLTVRLWDYCLLTPWSFRSLGDGWKPVKVDWE